MKEIQTIVYNFDNQKYKPLALVEAYKRSYNKFQPKNQSLDDYQKMFKNTMDVISYCGGTFGEQPGIVQFCFMEEYPFSTNPTNAWNALQQLSEI